MVLITRLNVHLHNCIKYFGFNYLCEFVNNIEIKLEEELSEGKIYSTVYSTG